MFTAGISSLVQQPHRNLLAYRNLLAHRNLFAHRNLLAPRNLLTALPPERDIGAAVLPELRADLVPSQHPPGRPHQPQGGPARPQQVQVSIQDIQYSGQYSNAFMHENKVLVYLNGNSDF